MAFASLLLNFGAFSKVGYLPLSTQNLLNSLGSDSLWVASVREGTEPGTWRWPDR